MDTVDEHELTYHMVIELLAHQFAFPVKWTDTQSTLFKTQNVERIVEIGPASTLATMAKRTLADPSYTDWDTAMSINRKILSCKSNHDDIYHAGANESPVSLPKPKPVVETQPAPPPQPPFPTPASTITDSDAASTGQVIEQQETILTAEILTDEPITASQVLTFLVAYKLKRLPSELPETSTIKALVQGRSTLENEIIGDLIEEFPVVPERAEESPLGQLAAELQAGGFAAKLGKKSSSIVNKEIASKMPGGFSIQKAREYLQQHWGLPAGRQDAVLMFAALSAPASRLKDEASANKFLDDTYGRYATEYGIKVMLASNTTIKTTKSMAMDAETSVKLAKAHTQFYQGLLEACSKALNTEQNKDLAAELRSQANSLQAQLDDWVQEHGETYASGIEPMMKKEKARTYDSSWNWALVDLLKTCYDLRTGATDQTSSASMVDSIANRSDKSLDKVISFLLEKERRASRKVQAVVHFLESVAKACTKTWARGPVFKPNFASLKPEITITEDGQTRSFEVPRWEPDNSPDAYIDDLSTVNELSGRCQPHLHLKARQYNGWDFDGGLTDIFFDEARDVCASGMSLANKSVLLTGAGRRSIGSEILGALLAAGANVVVTTSSFSVETARYFQELYATKGGRNSRLVVIPCNMASVRDLKSLVEWIYDDPKDGGLGWDLDYVIPFAALGEEGREIDNIDSRSELAHRVMLTNTIRLLGAVSERKRLITSHGGCRPAQVILPLSPNHGIFGGDGLYAESKLGLESLLRKWHTESWSDTLTICGCSIGWTRSTSLMKGNDIVAADVEGVLGVRTFSSEEMAFNIMVLMSPSMTGLCEDEPVYADFNGGLDLITDLKLRVDQIRADIQEKREILRAIYEEDKLEGLLQADEPIQSSPPPQPTHQQASMDVGFPTLPNFQDMAGDLANELHGMVDPDRVVVITGFGELGPHGSSRTRWQMEAEGRFSIEGCIEMAWIMGLIKHHAGPLPGKTERYFGWADAATGEPVADVDVKAIYEKRILDQSGIRLVEPALWDGYDPTKRQMLQEVVLEADLPPFEASEQEARDFKREHGDMVDIFAGESGQFSVVIKKGAALMIPKALNAGSHVAGQLPSGWDPRRYGIPDDIISQVDRITLFALICASEAFLSSGFTDPYELYKYVHLAEVGNCIGTGIGGATSLRKMHKGRFKDEPVQMDILQETFANTVTAWINMLLVSATGPIRTPVGACATGLESLDAACDLIVTGKAKVCLVGASDDMEENEASEFANMKATINSESDLDRGRTPAEMSRPATTSRAGFVEAQGCGVQIVMSASTALEMGAPIYAVVAYTGMASDKVSRSVPAPGKGILSTAREDASQKANSPPLALSARKAMLTERLRHIKGFRNDQPEDTENDYIGQKTQRMEADARYEYGNGFWMGSPGIAPIRGALAVWGLDVDDISVISFHGTSTKMNDRNELDIIQRQMTHLQRQPGNVLMGIFQKHLTGHPKGPASSWMLNGCLQVLRTGLVPGNRNADNIDKELKQFDFVAIPSSSVQTDGVSAFAINSFGFGQKGAQAVGVHPRYLYATLDPEVYEAYRKRVGERKRRVEQKLEGSMVSQNLVMLKTEPPYATGASEYSINMNPSARAQWHNESASYRFM